MRRKPMVRGRAEFYEILYSTLGTRDPSRLLPFVQQPVNVTPDSRYFGFDAGKLCHGVKPGHREGDGRTE